MISILISFIAYTLIAFVSSQIIPGIKIKGFGAAALVAFVFGVLNLLLGWLLTFLLTAITLPLACLTFGLFWFLVPLIVNAILLKITDVVLEPFELKGWLPAFAMSLLFVLGGSLIRWLS
jgi:putative membrane protein